MVFCFRTLDEAQEAFPLEPLGFTGKEDDLEVGLMYFGHRYLMPHLGRWATPDPLQIHSGGGGEFGNSYHYVGGNLLQARDPDGLEWSEWSDAGDGMQVRTSDNPEVDGGDMEFRMTPQEAEPEGRFVIRLRIDVPGNGAPSNPDDHDEVFDTVWNEDNVREMDYGHVWLDFDHPHDDSADIARGWYPVNPPSDGEELRLGGPGEMRDDRGHRYDYEAEFEVTEPEFEAAQQAMLEREGVWSGTQTCTQAALDGLSAAGVTGLPDGSVTVRVPPRFSEQEVIAPGQLARDLHEAEIGGYSHSPGTGDSSSSGGGSSSL